MPGTLISRPVSYVPSDSVARLIPDKLYYGAAAAAGVAPSAVDNLISWLQAGASNAAKSMGSRDFDGVS